MNEPKRDSDQYGERETRRRMDDALRRALDTPPQPKAKPKTAGGSKAAAKPRRRKARA